MTLSKIPIIDIAARLQVAVTITLLEATFYRQFLTCNIWKITFDLQFMESNIPFANREQMMENLFFQLFKFDPSQI